MDIALFNFKGVCVLFAQRHFTRLENILFDISEFLDFREAGLINSQVSWGGGMVGKSSF